jgi:hypothetical protein
MGMSSAPDTAGARAGPSWHPAANELGGPVVISRGAFGFFARHKHLKKQHFLMTQNGEGFATAGTLSS